MPESTALYLGCNAVVDRTAGVLLAALGIKLIASAYRA
jgi:hypothetical protein